MTKTSGALALLAVMVLTSIVVGATPAAAADWHPDPGAVPAGRPYVYFASEPGSRLGSGGSSTYTMAESDIAITATGGRIDLVIEGEQSWSATFRAPASATTIVPGRHEVLYRYPTNTPGATMDVSGPNHCGTVTGWFEVDDVAYTDEELSYLELRFELRCDDSSGLFHGEILWDTDAVPPAPHPRQPVPASMWSPPAGAIPDGTPRYLYIEAQPVAHPGAPATYLYDTTEEVADLLAFVSGTPGAGRILRVKHEDGVSRKWLMDLREPRWATGPATGFYDDLPPLGQDPIEGGFTTSYRRAEKVCPAFTSDVAVDELDIRNRKVTDITMRFVQTCATGDRTSYRGEVRWQTALRRGAPATPTGVTAVAGDGTATVAWSHPGGAEVRRFEVVTYRDGQAVATDIVGPEARSVVIDGLRPGAPYTFKVAAGADETFDDFDNLLPVISNRSWPSAPISFGPRPGPVPDPAPFADLDDLVAQQYVDFAGRPATPSEVSAGVDALESGAQTPAELVAAMRNRPEWGPRRAIVVRLYSAYFLRRPDTSGLEYWAGRLAAGTSVNQVSQSFAASPEFKTRYGSLTNGQFVQRVYQNVLGRAGTASEVQYWRDRMTAGLTRGAVMVGFSESPENKAHAQAAVDVILLVHGMLRRVPTAAELDWYSALITGGADPGDVASLVLRKAEYADRVT